jgi:hypothetical protein
MKMDHGIGFHEFKKSQKTFDCEECGALFRCRYRLNRHCYKFNHCLNFKCDCQEGFVSKHAVKIHKTSNKCAKKRQMAGEAETCPAAKRRKVM